MFTRNVLILIAILGLVAAIPTPSADAATVAYWNYPTSDRKTLPDLAGGDNNLTGANGLLGSAVNIAPNPLPNPDSPDYGAAGSILFGYGSQVGRTSNVAPFKLTSISSFTFEGWLRTTDTAFKVVAGDRQQTTGYKGWYVNISGGKLNFYSSFAAAVNAGSTTTISDNVPHHFAAVWDHDLGEMRLYIDGMLEDSESQTAGSYTQTYFGIGGRATGSDNRFNDNLLDSSTRLDELRFSDEALDPSQFLNYIPEPSTLVLTGLALAGLTLCRRKRAAITGAKSALVLVAIVGFAIAMHGPAADAATIAYWNTTVSGDLNDLTTNGNDLTRGLTASASATTIAPNPLPNPDTVGDAAGSIFFGSSSYAMSTTNGVPFKLQSNSSLTFEGWVNGNGFTGVIAGDRGANGFDGWYLHRIGTTTLRLDVLDIGDDTSLIANTNVADGNSHHFAFVWDHSNDLLSLYIDGSLEDSETLLASNINNSYSQTGFAIGGRAVNSDWGNADGSGYNDNRLPSGTRLDELRFSDEALEPSQFLNYIPEPSTLVLTGLALAGLTLRRRSGQ